jgi:hypothetical protein
MNNRTAHAFGACAIFLTVSEGFSRTVNSMNFENNELHSLKINDIMQYVGVIGVKNS